jgi:predicted GIY-YIG superfamily endonuclease
MFGRTNGNSSLSVSVYVLKLEDDCWYVGMTQDIDRRVREYFLGKV